MERSVLMVGIGGQGIQLIGKTLALAATESGLNAMLAAEYGGEMRGGTSQATAVVGDGPIRALPILPRTDSAIVMHDKFSGAVPERLDADGFLMLNSSIVDPAKAEGDHTLVSLPATDMAREIDAPQAAGLLMLGAFCRLTGIADHDHLVAAMTSLLPPYRAQHAETNSRALAAGAAAVSERDLAAVSV